MSWRNNTEVSNRIPLVAPQIVKNATSGAVAEEPTSQVIDSATNERNDEQLHLVFSTSQFDQETNKNPVGSAASPSSSSRTTPPGPPNPSELPLEASERSLRELSEAKAVSNQPKCQK